MNKDDKPYETQAVQTTITGWVCRTCNRYYGNDKTAQHCASYCCCTSRPCDNEGCNGRARKSYTVCDPCVEVADRRRYDALPRKEWDGIAPLCDDSGNFFWSSDAVEEFLDECACLVADGEDIEFPPRLFFTEEIEHASDVVYRHIEDFGTDQDDSFDPPDSTEIDKIVEEWLAKNIGKRYSQVSVVPTWESVVAHTGFTQTPVAQDPHDYD